MNIFLKAFIFIVIFSGLHFGYDLTKWEFLKPICGINESVFQHLKMAFWAYFLASIIDYYFFRNYIRKKDSFWYSRLLSSVIVPWIIFLIWYFIAAIYGKIEPLFLEILLALIESFIGGIIGGIIEKNIEKIDYTFGFKIAVLLLFFISGFLYVRFTYKPPWIDLFTEPNNLWKILDIFFKPCPT